jgi:TonB-linked SusC/RagA family outer membrane protein
MFRIPFVALTVLFCVVSADATAQKVADNDRPIETLGPANGDASPLARPARLRVSGVPLAAALSELAERAELWIAFSPSRLAGEMKVDCDCANLTVAEALDHLLAGTAFRHTQVDGHVVIIPRPVSVPTGVREVLPPLSPHFATGPATPLVSARRPALPTQQPTTISGVIVDAGSGMPLSGVSVRVEGTRLNAISSPRGRYILVNVPAGTHTLVASTIGYAAQSQAIEITQGETATVDFSLSVAPLQMDQLVVTATGERRRAEVANVIGKVDADAIVRSVPVANMSQLLTARSPGVQVVSVAGTVGGQTRIRIRGQSSVSLSNDPIVYLDGARVSSGYSGGMDTASRLDDLNPAEIQSIDILKGPAAVALYGTDAANGVIIMTTKRGGVGPPQWNVFLESGITEAPSGFPSAYYSAGQRTDTGAPTQCLLAAMASGVCVQEELRSFNLLEDPAATPFSTGRLNQTGVQLSGGSEGVRYFVSADVTDEIGTLRMPRNEQERITAERGVAPRRAQRIPNTLRSVNFRSNVAFAMSSEADLDVSIGYVDRAHQFTTSGGSIVYGLMRNALQGRGYEDERGGWWTYPAGDLFSVEETSDVGRLTGSVGADWRPALWLTTRARVGLDRVNEENSLLQRRDEGLVLGNFREGRVSEATITRRNYSVDLTATASYGLSPQVALRSSIGAQYFRNTTQSVSASGNNLAPGSESLGGTAVRSSSASISGSANLGAFFEQMVAYDDRVFVTGSIRTDQNSAFGKDFDAAFYPRASVSWLVSREPFFPESDALTSLRLRLAYGTSGVSPGTLHALQYYTSVQAFEDGVARPGLQFHAIGNADLEPERISELEAGFDLELFDGRATAELTRYRKLSRDALVSRPLAPSVGLNSLTRFENIGSVRNQGWEAALHLRLLEGRTWGWDVTLSGSTNDNELVKLGEGVTPATTFAGTRTEEGYPLWGRWARPILGWEDANGNGIIEASEVEVGDEQVYLGPSTPTREGVLSSSLSLLNGTLRIGGLLDHRGGHLAYNRTEADRCTAAANCRAVNDPTAPLWEQARAIAASTPALGSTHAGYFEDGAYTTLRELSVAVQIPERYSNLIRASGVSVSLAGRNLHTWSGYSGISPEGSWVDNMGLDMNLVPASRYWTIRINATY